MASCLKRLSYHLCHDSGAGCGPKTTVRLMDSIALRHSALSHQGLRRHCCAVYISGTLLRSAQPLPSLSAVQDGERLYYRKTVSSDTILTGRASLRNASNPNSWGVICECKNCKGQAVIKPTKFENCAGNGSAK